MEVNLEYYSLESDNKYMSCSQLDKFERCEAGYIAYLEGNNPNENSTAMLIGNYVHSWCEGTLDEFKTKYPEIFTLKGDLKSDFKHADTMISSLKKDKYSMYMLQGTKEDIFIGEIFGIPWKIRVDVWNEPKNRVIDLKTTKNIYEKEWKEGKKVSFLEIYNYQRRAAVYSEIIKQNTSRELPEFYIVAISKETIPDKAIIDMTDHERWQFELYNVKAQLERLKLVKSKKVESIRCEKCNYCKRTKVIKKIINYKEI